MIVLLNPKSGGNTATAKWKTVEPMLRGSGYPFSKYTLDDHTPLKRILLDGLRRCETDFVAAGGDGTVNMLLNSILETIAPEQLHAVRIGAIGLGSSNDFHKMPAGTKLKTGIPCHIDFSSVKPRDVGCLDCIVDGRPVTRYFLNNSSLGVTAEANARFNSPGKLLEVLKRFYTPGAIFATAFLTIAAFKCLDAYLQLDGRRKQHISLSNLAVLKNPHVTGTLCYPIPPALNDGLVHLALCKSMSRLGLLKLLWTLSRRSYPLNPGIEFRIANFVTVESKSPFAVEFDGEVVTTCKVRFRILPKRVQVCTC